MTLEEKYYAINAALNAWFETQEVRCPVVKFGVDPATLKASVRDQTNSRYPYFQSFLMNPQPQAWTSSAAGVYTRFEYQLSFYTSPDNEFTNDAALWLPFNLARIALSDVSLGVLSVDSNAAVAVTIADLLRVREERSFSMVSGAPVPRGVLIAEMAAVCSYPISTPDPGRSTDLDSAITISPED